MITTRRGALGVEVWVRLRLGILRRLHGLLRGLPPAAVEDVAQEVLLGLHRTVEANGPPRDINNPHAALRNRPIQGLPILTGFRDAGRNWEGTAYDPRAGKSYRSYLTLMRDGTLEVKGCIGPFCRTKSWTPAR